MATRATADGDAAVEAARAAFARHSWADAPAAFLSLRVCGTLSAGETAVPDALARILPEPARHVIPARRSPWRPALPRLAAPGPVFGSVGQASGFLRDAPVGYAATPDAGVFDGMALTAEGWPSSLCTLDDVRSSFFENPGRFAPGTATPDSDFLMAGLDTSWRAQPAPVAPQERV